MERAEVDLTARDALLLITDAAGGQIEGRTVMQKLAYFTSIQLGTTLGHRAYYYGPYSSRVDDALANAVVARELDQKTEALGRRVPGPEVMRYMYTLMPEGERRVQELTKQFPQQWHEIKRSVDAIRAVVPDLDQKMLSSAAKTYLIVAESEDEGVEQDELPELARRLGWTLTAKQVERTVELLERLELLDGDRAEDQKGQVSAGQSSSR